jgi:hypothetical protein
MGRELRVDEVILLCPISLVEVPFFGHLVLAVIRGPDLEDNLREDAPLLPHLVAPPVSFPWAERNVYIRGLADIGPTLDRINQVIPGDKHVWVVPEIRIGIACQQYDPAKLVGVVRHRQAIAVGVVHLFGVRGCEHGHRSPHHHDVSLTPSMTTYPNCE